MNSSFQQCARFLLELTLGSSEVDESYLNQLEALNDAAAEWLHANGGAVVLKLPRLGTSARPITGNLDCADAAGFCPDDRARAFIEWIDEKTGRTATLLMLQICCAIQDAHAHAPINTHGGDA